MNMSNQPERRKSKRLAGECFFTALVSVGKRVSEGLTVVATAVYDEQDGDFLFTRGAKRAKTNQAEPEVDTVAKPAARKDAAAQAKKPGRKKRASSPAEEPVQEVSAPRRTSRRISNQPAPSTPQDEQLAVPKSRSNQRRGRPPAEKGRRAKELDPVREDDDTAARSGDQPGTPMDVDRPANSDESPPQKIALPFSDTPIINRNRELRKGGGSARRSSLGRRGRRASSLIENGHSAIPHREVNPAEFYKHIESESLLEPRRMRQLLMWCGERALSEKPPHGARGSSAILGGKSSARNVNLRGRTLTDFFTCIARAIQDQLLKDFGARAEFSDWFSREDAPPRAAVVLKPNPRNIEHDEKIAELEAKIQR